MNSNQSRTKDRHVIYPNKEYQKKWRDNRNEKNGIYAVRRKGTDGFFLRTVRWECLYQSGTQSEKSTGFIYPEMMADL